MITYDVMVVGAGLTGATIARVLTDAGKKVLVIDRRPHVAGNCFDYCHASGVMINAHGPHYFRTNSDRVWSFVQRFAEWRPWAAEVRSLVAGKLEAWPPTHDWILKHCPNPIPALTLEAFPENFETACLQAMPRQAYEAFVKGYTEKQWGCKAAQLGPALASRFHVRHGADRRLKRDVHQALPVGGYTLMVLNMLKGIRYELAIDFATHRRYYKAALIIYTGAIDEYFDYRLGRLRYRGQVRMHHWTSEIGFRWPVVQVNFPSPEVNYLREIEWKHMMLPRDAAKLKGTLITREYPRNIVLPDQLEYPFPDDANQKLYREYRGLADKETNVLFAGRLGRYQYLDMDQAIAQGMMLGDMIASEGKVKERGRTGGNS